LVKRPSSTTQSVGTLSDPEPFGEIGALVHRDANDLEAVVVAPMLQHLR
jgi:hypothetical protein